MITEQEARDAAKRCELQQNKGLQEYYDDELTLYRWAIQELARREAERAAMESMLRGLLKTFDDADLERLAEVYERDEESERWKSEGDMYGWNFHKGAAAGCTSASIIFFRVKREIEKQLDILAALKGGVT